jgi:hypothetical protein
VYISDTHTTSTAIVEARSRHGAQTYRLVGTECHARRQTFAQVESWQCWQAVIETQSWYVCVCLACLSLVVVFDRCCCCCCCLGEINKTQSSSPPTMKLNLAGLGDKTKSTSDTSTRNNRLFNNNSTYLNNRLSAAASLFALKLPTTNGESLGGGAAAASSSTSTASADDNNADPLAKLARYQPVLGTLFLLFVCVGLEF